MIVDAYALSLGETMVKTILPPGQCGAPRLYRSDGHIEPSALRSLIKMLDLCSKHIADGARHATPVDCKLTWVTRDHTLITPELASLLTPYSHPTPPPLLTGRYVQTPDGLKWVQPDNGPSPPVAQTGSDGEKT